MSGVLPAGLPKPPPTTVRLLLKILGIGVSFVAGLAPFLGAKLNVPGFVPVIAMYPATLRDWLIPMSGILMALMAATLEFAAPKAVSQLKLKRWFVRTVVLFVASFLLLLIVYPFAVTRVDQAVAGPKGLPERTSSAFVTGALDVPRQAPGSECKCREGQSADRCIEDVSFKPSNIRTCFGSFRVYVASLVLSLLYLTLTGTFVGVVGLGVVSKLAAGRHRPSRGRSRATVG